jgi:hypothetical protein
VLLKSTSTTTHNRTWNYLYILLNTFEHHFGSRVSNWLCPKKTEKVTSDSRGNNTAKYCPDLIVCLYSKNTKNEIASSAAQLCIRFSEVKFAHKKQFEENWDCWRGKDFNGTMLENKMLSIYSVRHRNFSTQVIKNNFMPWLDQVQTEVICNALSKSMFGKTQATEWVAEFISCIFNCTGCN